MTDDGSGTFQVFYGAGSPFDPDTVVATHYRVPEPVTALLLVGPMGLILRRRRSGTCLQRGTTDG